MNNAQQIQIAVVIPFYQKEKGILTKSLQSVFLQSEPQYISEIVIVDDGSPCPAEPEVNEIRTKFNNSISIKLIKQKNAGVSRARNTALANVAENCTHIAFLDSDDRWEPNHIRLAVKAMRLGAKFYFANHYQLDCDMPAFQKASNFKVSDSLQVEEAIYKYTECFINQVILSNPVGTSTVVYSRRETKDIVFDKKFKYAGEDYMMWISLVRRLGEVYFCSIPTVVYESGVNIFSSAKWGTLHLTERLIDEIEYRKSMSAIPELNLNNKVFLDNKVKELKRSLLGNTQSRLKRFQFSGFFTAIKAYFK